jgi:hypothetical protein
MNTRRKPIDEMSSKELQVLVAEMRARTEVLNEELRVLQDQVKENERNIHRMNDKPGGTGDSPHHA